MEKENSITMDVKVPQTMHRLLMDITGAKDFQEAIEKFSSGCIVNFMNPQEMIDALYEVHKKYEVSNGQV